MCAQDPCCSKAVTTVPSAYPLPGCRSPPGETRSATPSPSVFTTRRGSPAGVSVGVGCGVVSSALCGPAARVGGAVPAARVACPAGAPTAGASVTLCVDRPSGSLTQASQARAPAPTSPPPTASARASPSSTVRPWLSGQPASPRRPARCRGTPSLPSPPPAPRPGPTPGCAPRRGAHQPPPPTSVWARRHIRRHAASHEASRHP